VLTKGYSVYFNVTGDMNVPAPDTLRDGMIYTIALIEDGTGGHNFTFDAVYEFGDAGAPDVNTGANIVTFLSGPYFAVTGKIHANHRRGA
jgi:hypothetical protein